MGEISSAVAALSDKIPPWVAITSVLMLSGSALILSLIQLGQKFGMFARDIGGTGATPSQVKSITESALDKKINGGLDRILAKLEALEEKVDVRHAENQRLFGQIEGQLASRGRRA